jgi:glycerol kinase
MCLEPASPPTPPPRPGPSWPCPASPTGIPSSLPEIVDSAGPLGTFRHPDWGVELPFTARVVDQQAALAGAGCVEAGRVKATYGTGVFVLANTGKDRPRAPEGLLPTVAWRVAGEVEYALDGGVFTAGALLEWLSRDLGLAQDPAALVALAEGVEDSGGVRLLPALAGLGAPWWRSDAHAVVAGLSGGTRASHIAWAALDALAWRVADIVEAVRRHADVDVLRVDGGLTRSAVLLQLQADAAGVPVELGAVDATVAGAAALAAVGAGLWGTTAEIAERVPTGRRVEPAQSDAWRRERHDRWRDFVERASAIS